MTTTCNAPAKFTLSKGRKSTIKRALGWCEATFTQVIWCWVPHYTLIYFVSDVWLFKSVICQVRCIHSICSYMWGKIIMSATYVRYISHCYLKFCYVMMKVSQCFDWYHFRWWRAGTILLVDFDDYACRRGTLSTRQRLMLHESEDDRCWTPKIQILHNFARQDSNNARNPAGSVDSMFNRRLGSKIGCKFYINLLRSTAGGMNTLTANMWWPLPTCLGNCRSLRYMCVILPSMVNFD